MLKERIVEMEQYDTSGEMARDIVNKRQNDEVKVWQH